jgi:uncharacterized RDD family membrane protein YckC
VELASFITAVLLGAQDNMDIVTQAHRTTSQPRLFWRRAFAYLIDIAIFEILFSILLSVLALIIPLNVEMPFFQSTRCEQVDSGPLVEKVQSEWPLKPGEKRENQLCHVTRLIGPDSVFFETAVISGNPDGGAFSSRVVSTPLGQNGEPINPVSGQVGTFAGFLLMPLAFAYFSANGRRTLGKKILSLRVTTIEGGSPNLGKEVKREFLKFLPLIVFAGASLVGAVTSASPDQSFETMIGAMRDGTALTTTPILTSTVFLIATFLWWALPLVKWRGQMFYDRFCGCEVRRT